MNIEDPSASRARAARAPVEGRPRRLPSGTAAAPEARPSAPPPAADPHRGQATEAARRRAAYHEAGHVVAAWLAGLPVGRGSGAAVETVGETVWGRADLGATPSRDELLRLCLGGFESGGFGVRLPARRKLEAVIISTFAGPFAEARAIEEGLAEAEATGPAKDLHDGKHVLALRQVARTAAGLGVADDAESIDRLLEAAILEPAERSTFRDWLAARAAGLVHSPAFWAATSAVADALMFEGSLSGRHCLRVMREALAPKAADVAT